MMKLYKNCVLLASLILYFKYKNFSLHSMLIVNKMLYCDVYTSFMIPFLPTQLTPKQKEYKLLPQQALCPYDEYSLT